jgi:hypothetical protein
MSVYLLYVQDNTDLECLIIIIVHGLLSCHKYSFWIHSESLFILGSSLICIIGPLNMVSFVRAFVAVENSSVLDCVMSQSQLRHGCPVQFLTVFPSP